MIFLQGGPNLRKWATGSELNQRSPCLVRSNELGGMTKVYRLL